MSHDVGVRGARGAQHRASEGAGRVRDCLQHHRAHIVDAADDFIVAVSGDPLRTNSITFAHNGILGYTVAREIDLPANWEAKLKSVR